MYLEDIINRLEAWKVLGQASFNNLEIRDVDILDRARLEAFRAGDFKNSLLLVDGELLEGLADLGEGFFKELRGQAQSALGLRSDWLEEDLLERLEGLGLPVLVLATDSSLEDLAFQALKLISSNKSRVIRENELISNAFMEMNVRQATIPEYLNLLKEIIGIDLIYFGKLDYLTYASGEMFLTMEEIEDIGSLDLSKYFLAKIQKNKQTYGYLILREAGDNISQKDRLLVDYTISMILIQIQNQIAIDNSKELVRSDLIADLCMNNIKSREELIFRANLQGWEIRSSGLLALIFDIDEFKHSMLHSNKNYDELEEEKEIIYKLVITEMEKIPYDSYFYRKSDSIIFLVNVDFENNLSDIDQFIDRNIRPIRTMLNSQGLSFTLTIGIGSYYDDIMESYRSYNEAIEAINISRIFKEVDDICCYKDVIIFKDLMELASRKDYNSIYTQLIKKIQRLDRENKTEYFKTLRAIIKSDWNLKESAKLLFIHYNTVLYRFEKLKGLLGLGLDNFYEKLIITLAVMLLEVEKHIDFNKGVFKK